MSQIGNREPGLVGAALDNGSLSAGLIADGIHVDPANVGISFRAKRGPGNIVLVTDAMATIGTDLTSFTLNGRTIHRKDGRLTLTDGTLAGADLDMISAVRFVRQTIGLGLDDALRMASLYPAEAIGQAGRLGSFVKGGAANVVALSDELDVSGVWIDGKQVFAG
jgi:N-acetylglucosamine-6-phosphate deacetylase